MTEAFRVKLFLPHYVYIISVIPSYNTSLSKCHYCIEKGLILMYYMEINKQLHIPVADLRLMSILFHEAHVTYV